MIKDKEVITISNIDTLQMYLINIFNYYKQLYDFNFYLQFTAGGCYYKHYKHINIDIAFLKTVYKLNKIQRTNDGHIIEYNNFVEFCIGVLLHELGHAIHLKTNKKEFYRGKAIEQQSSLRFVAFNSVENMNIYYPLEYFADTFANSQLEKWNCIQGELTNE